MKRKKNKWKFLRKIWKNRRYWPQWLYSPSHSPTHLHTHPHTHPHIHIHCLRHRHCSIWHNDIFLKRKSIYRFFRQNKNSTKRNCIFDAMQWWVFSQPWCWMNFDECFTNGKLYVFNGKAIENGFSSNTYHFHTCSISNWCELHIIEYRIEFRLKIT